MDSEVRCNFPHDEVTTVLDMRGSNPLSRSMKIIKVTMKEIYDAMRPSVEKNKKKYTRKTKHKNDGKRKMGDI